VGKIHHIGPGRKTTKTQKKKEKGLNGNVPLLDQKEVQGLVCCIRERLNIEERQGKSKNKVPVSNSREKHKKKRQLQMKIPIRAFVGGGGGWVWGGVGWVGWGGGGCFGGGWFGGGGGVVVLGGLDFGVQDGKGNQEKTSEYLK